MSNQIDTKVLDGIMQAHDYNPAQVIAIMQDVQKEYRYLPEAALSYIASGLKISEAKVYGVATFYENFSLEPKGKYVIKVCDGTACHVRKSVPILEEFRNVLGVSSEHPTTEDGLFTVETVSCLGACGLAPVMTIDGEVHAKMDPETALALLEDIRAREDAENA